RGTLPPSFLQISADDCVQPSPVASQANLPVGGLGKQVRQPHAGQAASWRISTAWPLHGHCIIVGLSPPLDVSLSVELGWVRCVLKIPFLPTLHLALGSGRLKLNRGVTNNFETIPRVEESSHDTHIRCTAQDR